MSMSVRCGGGSLIAWVCLALWAAAPVAAEPERALRLNIAAQPVGEALNEFAQQSGLQVVIDPQESKGIRVQELVGVFTVSDALEKLLANTGLRFEYLNERTVAVRGVKTTAIGTENEAEVLRDSTLRLAQAQSNAELPAQKSSDSTEGQQLQEIVVTAQKREERLQDVPTAVTAISGDRLQELQINSLADLVGYVPGAAIVNFTPGFRTVVLRGISSNSFQYTTAATVATYIDDLAVGSAATLSRGAQWGVDLSPFDIERVEVLKGPQGTLYGSNAMTGLVKYVLRRPSLSQLEARVGGEMETVEGSGGIGWTTRAAVSIPVVSEKLGVRFSGAYKDNDGFIDNIGTNTPKSNSWTQKNGMASALFQPTERFSVYATVLAQDIEGDDLPTISLESPVSLPLGPRYGEQLKSSFFLEPYRVKLRNYALTLDWDLGFASLISASGWSELDSGQDQDLAGFGRFTPGHPDSLALFHLGLWGKKFVQEIRLASSDDPSRSSERIQWLIGGFYTEEENELDESIPTFTPAYEPLPDSLNLLTHLSSQNYEEWAGFGNITVKITDRFDVGGGGRYSIYDASNCNVDRGGVFPTSTSCNSQASVSIWNWMVNARFHLDRDAMVYVRYATGYRPGSGCDFNADGTPCGHPALGIPGRLDPDKTTNYEIGFKGQFFGQRLGLDVSAFYIDWTDIQMPQQTPDGLGYAGNGGNATSAGLELTTFYQLAETLRLGATLAYTDAHLTEDSPANFGRDGDQLPSSARWAGSVTAEYDRPLNDQMSLIAGGGYRYREEVYSSFESHPVPNRLPAQSFLDLYTGVSIRDTSLRVFATNVLKDRVYTAQYGPFLVPVKPRTIGFSVEHRF